MEYGRGLAFNHDLNAFTKESRGMAAFASQLALTYLDHYGQIGEARCRQCLRFAA